MRNVRDVALENQASSYPLANQERKTGMEIVRSANPTSRVFRRPRPKHYFPVWDENDVWARRVGAKRQGVRL